MGYRIPGKDEGLISDHAVSTREFISRDGNIVEWIYDYNNLKLV